MHLDTDAVLLGEIAFAPFRRLEVGGQDLGPRSLWVMGAVLVLNVLFITLLYKELKVSTFDFERSRFDAPPRSVLTHLIPTAADFDWSPDGNTVVYVVRPRRMEDLLVFHDISTGDVRQVRTAIRGIGGPRFMPDGRAVVVRGVDETKHGSLGLHRIDLKTGETELLVAVGGPSHRPEISPDGTKLYYRRFLPKNEMAFLERDLRTGAERALVQRGEPLGSRHQGGAQEERLCRGRGTPQKRRDRSRLDAAADQLGTRNCRRKLAADPRFTGGDTPGFFGVLHTWGRELQYHPHIHYVVPGGMMESHTGNWRPSSGSAGLLARSSPADVGPDMRLVDRPGPNGARGGGIAGVSGRGSAGSWI